MLITRNVVKSKCVVVDRITNERFFIRKEGKYFTVYEMNNGVLSVVLEVSLKENHSITPEELWGIIQKDIKNENLYIEQRELEKFRYESKEKFDEALSKKEKIKKELNLQVLKADDKKRIEIEWKRRLSLQSK